MKAYIVYVDGIERGTIRAASHNAAERIANQRYGHTAKPTPDWLWGGIGSMRRVTVAYTER